MSDDSRDPEATARVSRRDFIKGLGTGALGAAVLSQSAAPAAVEDGAKVAGPGAVPIHLKVNGQVRTLNLEPRVTLLDALRDHLDLTGAKKICNMGSCGGCTVQIDGQPEYSCMRLAIDAQGHDIRTVEGLSNGDQLHPVQEAFIQHDALMCGFCTPGFIMTVSALVQHNHNPSLEQVRQACSGNTCRCGTYPRIFAAAMEAARKMGGA